jgi:hypothetical protein
MSSTKAGSAAASRSPGASFTAGEAVIVHGLVNTARYNGCVGVVVSFDVATGRHHVRLSADGASAASTDLRVKFANLRHADENTANIRKTTVTVDSGPVPLSQDGSAANHNMHLAVYLMHPGEFTQARLDTAMAAGADANFALVMDPRVRGMNLLLYACNANNAAAIVMLVAAGADVNKKSGEGGEIGCK